MSFVIMYLSNLVITECLHNQVFCKVNEILNPNSFRKIVSLFTVSNNTFTVISLSFEYVMFLQSCNYCSNLHLMIN